MPGVALESASRSVRRSRSGPCGSMKLHPDRPPPGRRPTRRPAAASRTVATAAARQRCCPVDARRATCTAPIRMSGISTAMPRSRKIDGDERAQPDQAPRPLAATLHSVTTTSSISSVNSASVFALRPEVHVEEPERRAEHRRRRAAPSTAPNARRAQSSSTSTVSHAAIADGSRSENRLVPNALNDAGNQPDVQRRLGVVVIELAMEGRADPVAVTDAVSAALIA